jgi:simple sugar transport system ATP-binding protein
VKVELRDIHKYFGPVRANHGVTFCVEPGIIHGLLGENGAGKSTLMKVLSGFFSPDRGAILLDGVPVRITSPAWAVTLGIGMLHQDPLDFPSFRVLDSFLLGCDGGTVLDRSKARHSLITLAEHFDFNLDPEASVSSLTLGERQQLEIVRLLWLGVHVLILDEPTTAISAQQKGKLFAALRKLAGEKRSVIFVSHKLEEVGELCSRVTVLARGEVAGNLAMPCRRDELVQMMFGRNFAAAKRGPVRPGKLVLELNSLTVSDRRLEVRDLSLTVREGEVIGLAGLEGSGQQLILRACAGLARPTGGQICIGGRDMTGESYRQFLKAGVAYMPSNRLEEGLIAGMTLTEHMALVGRKQSFRVNWKAASERAYQCIAEFKIKGQPATRVEELSGGNQQRTLLALLPPELKLMLMEHPARGLDAESAEYIWGLLLVRTQRGTAILFSSADLDELVERSDSIAVFFGGRAHIVDARQANIEKLQESIGGIGFE